MKKLFDKHKTLLPCGSPARPHRATPSVGSGSVASSFQSWLLEVAADTASEGKARHLTTDEMIDVNVATVRESTTHRHWPKDVVEKFLAAELIDTSSKPGQEANDSRGFASLVSHLLGWRTKNIPAPITLNREARNRAT